MTAETVEAPATGPYPDFMGEPSAVYAARDQLRASFFLRTDTPIAVFDYLSDGPAMRVTGIHIGDLAMHVGMDGDAEIVDSIDRLTGFLQTVAELRRSLKRIRHAAAEDSTRPILESIAFQTDGERLRLVATDSFRLAVITVEATGDLAALGSFCLGLADADTLRAFLRGCGYQKPVSIEHNGGTVTFRADGRFVGYRTADGRYPAFQKVIDVAEALPDKHTVRWSPFLLAGLVDAKAVVMEMTIGTPNDIVTFADPDSTYREYIMPSRTADAPMPANYEAGFSDATLDAEPQL